MTIAGPDAPVTMAPPTGIGRMYAIAFDVNAETLQRAYGAPSWAARLHRDSPILADEGFAWQQGSVNFGLPDRVDAVACVLAIQRLTGAPVVRSVRPRRPHAPHRREQ